MSSAKRKCRQYSVSYLQYGFIPAPNSESQPMCLLCKKVFSNEAMKPSRLSEHLTKIHPDKAEEGASFFQTIWDNFKKRKTVDTMFSNLSHQNDEGLRASYNLSLLIAKKGKPHSLGEEVILPAVKEVLDTVLHHKSSSTVIKSIPLSNNTVQRRVDEMATDIEASLCRIIRNTEFSLQLDESTLPGNESLLLGYVRFVHDGALHEELAIALTLDTNTRGETVFQEVKTYFEKNQIPLANVLSCATDGAPSMVGRYRGFIAFLKAANPNVITIHCVIHRQHLVAKNISGRLNHSLGTVIKAVNKIKVCALNTRLFKQLCIENDEAFERLLLHTEVRWLSKGNCLTQFYTLIDTAVEFLESCDPDLAKEIIDIKNDIAYLADIFGKFNELNLSLQGNEVNLIKVKSVLCAFKNKLLLYGQNLARREFFQFSSLQQLDSGDKGISNVDVETYSNHLQKLHEDMEVRFQDVLQLEIPDWIVDPFIDISEQGILAEELITLQNDFELKPKFRISYQAFWLQREIKVKYRHVWDRVKSFFIAFPSLYLVERAFSAVTTLLDNKRNRLDIVRRGDLRLFLTKMEPDIKNLMKLHQAHPSH